MATALNRLLDDPELRMEMGRAARDRVINEFGLRKMAARTLDLYRNVASKESRNGVRADAAPQSDHSSAAIDGDNLSAATRLT